ncbi:Uncharacterised protein [Alistipes finegoldii]|nr:Uncharacterised protein [Alistipes finegoldii]
MRLRIRSRQGRLRGPPHRQHRQLHPQYRTAQRRDHRNGTLRNRRTAGGTARRIRAPGHVPAAIRRADQSPLPATADTGRLSRHRGGRLVGDHAAPRGSRRAQVARPLPVGLACRRGLRNGVHTRRTPQTGGRLHGKIQRGIRQIPDSHRVMVHRRLYARVHVRQIRHRRFVQLQRPDRYRRLHAVGRLLEPGLLSQPGQRLHACSDPRGTDPRPRIPHAGQRPDLPVRQLRGRSLAGGDFAGTRLRRQRRQPPVGRVVLPVDVRRTLPRIRLHAGRAGKLLHLGQHGEGAQHPDPAAGKPFPQGRNPCGDAHPVGRMVPGEFPGNAPDGRYGTDRLP